METILAQGNAPVLRSVCLASVGLLLTLWAPSTSAAPAAPLASAQQVVIDIVSHDMAAGQFTGPFTLLVTDGRLKADRGTFTGSGATLSQGTRDGQHFELGKGTNTLVGKEGTLVIAHSDRWVQADSAHAVATGTWRVVRGTGQYAGVTGGGRYAGTTGCKRNVGYFEHAGFLKAP